MARFHASIAERASEQLGLLRAFDLDQLGLSERQRRTCTSAQLLVRLGPGLFRHAGFPPIHEQRLLAAVWLAGSGGALSHLAAASVWGFDGIRPGAVEVSVPLPRNPRSVEGRVHRVRDLPAQDVTTKGLLAVTTPARTLIDCATRLQPAQLEEALDGACRRGQIYVPHLEWRLEQLRASGRVGVARLADLLCLPHRDRTEESWLESAFLRVLRRSGLPLPRIQAHVVAEPGGKRYRLDACYDDRNLVIEIDGHATHATRRQRQADAERDARLVAQGKQVVRFTYEDVVERPGYITATLATLLGLPFRDRLPSLSDARRAGN